MLTAAAQQRVLPNAALTIATAVNTANLTKFAEMAAGPLRDASANLAKFSASATVPLAKDIVGGPLAEPPVIPRVEALIAHSPLIDVVEQQAESNEILRELVAQVIASRADQEQVNRRILLWAKVSAVAGSLVLLAAVVTLLAMVFHW
jgi:hypothetical protein